MLPVSWDTIRLFLHVSAATIWVGGQLTLAFLVGPLRRLGAELPRAAGQAYHRIAWPAFGVLIVTGIWNIIAVRSELHGSYAVTVWVKISVVALSGLSAWLHQRSKSIVALAIWGTLTGVSALAALFVGILLAG